MHMIMTVQRDYRSEADQDKLVSCRTSDTQQQCSQDPSGQTDYNNSAVVTITPDTWNLNMVFSPYHKELRGFLTPSKVHTI